MVSGKIVSQQKRFLATSCDGITSIKQRGARNHYRATEEREVFSPLNKIRFDLLDNQHQPLTL